MLKVIFFALISFNVFAEDCRPSIYEYKGKPLCFSLKYKSYFTKDCATSTCGAHQMMELALLANIPGKSGMSKCEALGGTEVQVKAPKVKDELCLCVAKDQSGVSCTKLGFR